jgi:hypothetical protein
MGAISTASGYKDISSSKQSLKNNIFSELQVQS